MTAEPSIERNAGSGSTPARSPHKVSRLNAYLFRHRDIPVEVAGYIFSRLGADAVLHPARRNGSYKGSVLLDSSGWLVLAIGQDKKTAIAHRKDDVALLGNLQWRSANRKLHGASMQIHYNDERAKAYPLGVAQRAIGCAGDSHAPRSSKGVER